MLFFIYFIILYYFITNLFYLLLLFQSWRHIKKNIGLFHQPRAQWPNVTVILSARNEQKYILKTLECIYQNSYPDLEIILVNDGSTDNTWSLLQSEYALSLKSENILFKLYESKKKKNIHVIDKVNTGKADSMNLALSFVKTDYVLTVDADTIIEENAIQIVMSKMLENSNNHAVGGVVRILNGSFTRHGMVVKGKLPKNVLAMIQTVEYIRSFFGSRIGWENIGGTALIAGAFCLYKTKSLNESGKFDPQSITEDFESNINLLHYYRKKEQFPQIHMVPNPTCWTLAPEKLKDLFGQRVRWHKGLVQTLYRHRKLIFNPRIGVTGMLTLPFMLICEALSPVVEICSYLVIFFGVTQNLISPLHLGAGVILGIVYYTLVTLVSVWLEESTYTRHHSKKAIRKFFIFSFLENIGYRQILLIAKLVGLLQAFNRKNIWNEHQRGK